LRKLMDIQAGFLLGMAPRLRTDCTADGRVCRCASPQRDGPAHARNRRGGATAEGTHPLLSAGRGGPWAGDRFPSAAAQTDQREPRLMGLPPLNRGMRKP
jgi:hypothetical protein